MRSPAVSFLVAVLARAVWAGAAFSVDGIFADHMVLQRDRPVRVSGSAEPGLAVAAEFRNERREVRCGEDGRWAVEFSPSGAGGPYELKITPGWTKGEPVVLSDILVGEVWVCAGQSNMSFPVWGDNRHFRLPDGEEVAASAKDGRLRLFSAARSIAVGGPCADPVGRVRWMAADNPSAVRPFSAVGYHFGALLRESLPGDIPVGIVNLSWGGTKIEPWIPETGYAAEGRTDLLGSLRACRSVDSVAEHERLLRSWLEAFMSGDPARSAEALREWGKTDVDLTGWKTAPYEDMTGLDSPGVVWYRFEFEVPRSWEKDELVFHMDAVNDADETFLDGTRIGATGPLMGIAEYWHVPRDYRFRAAAGRHAVAVRAADHYGVGYVSKVVWVGNPRTGEKLELGNREWKERVEFRADLEKIGDRPEILDPRLARGSKDTPSVLYNAMVHPVSQMNIAGVVWYQGCSNSGNPKGYAIRQRMLIRSWRHAFRDANLPFVLTQLSALQRHSPEDPLPDDFWTSVSPTSLGFAPLRAAQEEVSADPAVGLACTIDLGEASDVHPKRKKEVAERLLHEALRLKYGRADRLPGPRCASVRTREGGLEVSFRDVGSGLEARGGIHPHMFAVAGRDGVYRWAEAELRPDGCVFVRSREVPNPVSVRYAYSAYPPQTTIYRKGDGLPLFPFEATVDVDSATCGMQPQEVVRKIAEQFLSTSPERYLPKGFRGTDYLMSHPYGEDYHVHYAVVSLWTSAIECARKSGDLGLMKRLIARFEPFYGEKRRLCTDLLHVDYTVFGALPLEIYLASGDRRAREMGLRYAEVQWAEPREDDRLSHYDDRTFAERLDWWRRGYSPQTRLWIDDTYMISFLQTQAWRVDGDRRHLDLAAAEMAMYLEKIQLANGLFYHAPDVPYAWARGNGWMAAGMALLLSCLPEDNPHWTAIRDAYLRMMSTLRRFQRSDGLWGQLVDEPDSWGETSGSAMFAFAFQEGINQGLLPADPYEACVRRAYAALVARMDEYGNISDVCEGTGKKNDHAYYLARGRVNGDPHGQAPMLWLCSALMGGGSRRQALPAAKTLAERFAEPSMEDRRQVGPLFWLHGTETPDELEQLVDVVAESGQGVMTVESRHHDDWMGPGWWRDLDVVFARAKARNLKVMIYDDPWWPSQAMQGRVPDAFGCHVVAPEVVAAAGALPVVVSNEICRIRCRRLAADKFAPAGDGDVWIVFRDERRDVRVNEGKKLLRMVNGLDPAAVSWFIDAVYEEHYRRYRPYFDDGTVIGYFFDEPETHGTWGPALRDLLIRRGEEALLPKMLLAQTFALPDAEETAALRHRFLTARAEAWGRTMYGGLSEWCRRRGVFSSGHFMEHTSDFYQQKLNAGDVMAMEKYVDVPGIDLVIRQYYPADQQPGAASRDKLTAEARRLQIGEMPMISSSVAHVRNAWNGLNWSEVFGGYRQWLTSFEMKWLADWHHARGCHFLIPHSFNPRAPFDSDYPPYFYNGGREPRFGLFRVWADYTSRIALMMSGAEHRCPVAQVVPGQSFNTGRAIRPEGFTVALRDAQLDCDWFSIGDLSEARIETDPLNRRPVIRSARGAEGYPVLVMPAAERVEFAALEKALAFARAGGRVIGYGIRPSATSTRNRSAADVAALMKELSRLPSMTFLSGEPGAAEVLAAMPSDIADEARRFQNGAGPCTNLHVRHVVRDGRDVWFVANQSTREPRTVALPSAAGGRVTEIWDPMSGQMTAAGTGPVTLEKGQSVFLVIGDEPSAGALPACIGSETVLPASISFTESRLPPPKDGEIRGPFDVTVRMRVVFTVPDDRGEKARIIVRCGAPEGEPSARVEVNGRYAGGFIGEPFEVDVTRFAHVGQNELSLTPFRTKDVRIVLREPVP